MHELALTEGILSIVASEQKKQAFTRVLEISLKVGEYSGVIPSCIEEFFPLAAKGTAAEGAKLTMTRFRGCLPVRTAALKVRFPGIPPAARDAAAPRSG